MQSFIRSIGYESRFVLAFSMQESSQRRTVPSFVAAKTIGVTRSGFAGFIIFRDKKFFNVDFFELLAFRSSTT